MTPITSRSYAPRSTVDLMTAASASGLGRTKAYEGDTAIPGGRCKLLM
jgi:hypothetical protein